MFRAIWKRIPKAPLIGAAIVAAVFLAYSARVAYRDVSNGACAHAGPADFRDRAFRVLWCGKPVAFVFAAEARHGTSDGGGMWPMIRVSKSDPTRPITFE